MFSDLVFSLSIVFGTSKYVPTTRPSLGSSSIIFQVIYPFSISVMVFQFPYFAPKFICFFYIWLLIYTCALMKAWTAIDKLSIIWKSNLTDKMKRSFFLAAVVSILLYGCTTWKKTAGEEARWQLTKMLRAILNKSWRQHPTRHQLYGNLPPIMKTIQVRRTRHAGHCWRSRDELISDVLLWTPTYGRAKAGRPTRTYIQQLCDDTGGRPEDLPEAMNDREEWRERVRDIRASSTTWWWWWNINAFANHVIVF